MSMKSVHVQDALIHHMQEPCWGPAIPIELAGQAAFVAMLQHAASHRQDLLDNMHNLQWAQHFDGRPAAW